MTDNNPNKTPAPTPAPVAEIGYLQSAKEALSSTFGPVSDSLSEYTKEVGEWYKVARGAYSDFTRSGPGYLSNFKKDFVYCYPSLYRDGAHKLVTITFFLLSLKFKRGGLIAIRDTAFLYYGYGALFNPEAVNPFLV